MTGSHQVETAPKDLASGTPEPGTAAGDDAKPGTIGTGENVCPACQGSGLVDNVPCQQCDGTGVVIEGIGGG